MLQAELLRRNREAPEPVLERAIMVTIAGKPPACATRAEQPRGFVGRNRVGDLALTRCVHQPRIRSA